MKEYPQKYSADFFASAVRKIFRSEIETEPSTEKVCERKNGEYTDFGRSVKNE